VKVSLLIEFQKQENSTSPIALISEFRLHDVQLKIQIKSFNL